MRPLPYAPWIVGLCAALGAALGGCSSSQTETPSPAATAAASPPSVTLQPTASPTADGESQESSSVARPSRVEPVAAAFQPPFPNRVNLFQAPRRQGRVLAEAKGQKGAAVELLGFVNVDRPRVVLAVDGLVTSLAEGSEEFGIEVISIQPPKVMLQRDRQRWQATLEN